MKLPDKIFGIDTKEAYANYYARANKEKEIKKPSPIIIPNSDKYILLEARTHNSYSYPDILTSIEKAHLGLNWNQAQETLHKNNQFMLTPRQYIDLINVLKSGKAYDGSGKLLNQSAINSVLDEMLTVRDPWRSEWLDASFNAQGDLYTITYHKITNKGLEQFTEPLDPDTLMKDKTPGISLDDWLNNATHQGLPRAKTKKGGLYYWSPGNDAVAWFLAGSGRADFGCGRDPQNSGSSLGVRPSLLRSSAAAQKI